MAGGAPRDFAGNFATVHLRFGGIIRGACQEGEQCRDEALCLDAGQSPAGMLATWIPCHVEVLCDNVERQIRTASRKLNLSACEFHPQNTVSARGDRTCGACGSHMSALGRIAFAVSQRK
jgi:hypothetical protein